MPVKSGPSPPGNSLPSSLLFLPPPSSNPLLAARQSRCKRLPSTHPAAPGPRGRPPFDPDRGSRRIFTAAAADPWILEAAGSSLASSALDPTLNSTPPHLRLHPTHPRTFLLVAKLLPLTKHRRSAQRELLALSLLSSPTTPCQATFPFLSPGHHPLWQPSPQPQGSPTHNPTRPQFLSFLQSLTSQALHQPAWRNSQTE